MKDTTYDIFTVSMDYIRFCAAQNLPYSLLCQSFLIDFDRPYRESNEAIIKNYIYVSEVIQTFEN